MNKASNFSISHETRIVIMQLLMAAFIVLTAIILVAADNDETDTCSSELIAQGYTCITT